MANLFQHIFLPKKKLDELKQQQEIISLASSNPIMHHAYVTKTGGVARRFTIKTPTHKIYVERTFERFRPIDESVQYSLRVDNSNTVSYATHSSVNKMPEIVYTKIYKIWTKNKQNAR